MVDVRSTAQTLPDWLLYITNHFTHPVIEAQVASPRYHLARKLAEKGQKMLVYCPLGTHEGSPIHDFLANSRPRKYSRGNTTYLFPPLLVSPTSVGTVPALVLATIFIMLYLSLTRLKVSAQYCTTILVGSVGAVLRMRMKIPMVANYGDPDFAREFGLSRKAFRFCEDLVLTRRNAHCIVYVDEVVGEYLRTNFAPKRSVFLPNGGYQAGFSPEGADSARTNSLRRSLGLVTSSVVLYAGQLEPYYRLDLLVQAATSVIAEVPVARFVIVGEGRSLPGLRMMVHSAKLDDYFIFVGGVPYSELGPYLAASDVCVNLTNDWCMGTKVLMYMANRRAVLSAGSWYDKYGLFLRDGGNCILVSPDREHVASALVRLLKNGELRRLLTESAWKTVLPYTWDFHADQTLRVLAEAASSRGRTSSQQ